MACYLKGAIYVAVFALAAGTWTAARAQVAQPGARMAQGWVVSVQPGNGQGIFRIRTGTSNNQLGAGVNRAGGGAMQQFMVGPATHFESIRGAVRAPASFATLRPGQRVMVQAQGQQAIGVRIMARNQYAGGIRRPGSSVRGRAPRGHTGQQSAVRLTSTQRAVRASQPTAGGSNHVHAARMPSAGTHAMWKRR